MKTRLFAIAVVCLLVPVFVYAQGTCATATGMDPNGQPKDFDFVLNGATQNYTFQGIGGSSYCVTAKTDYEGVAPSLVTLGAQSGACGATSAIPGITDTSAAEPIVSNGHRLCFIMPGTAGTTQSVQVQVQNTDTTGHYIRVESNETAYSLTGFSTFGAAQTYVTIMNTTHSNITGTLTFYNGTNGAVLKTGTVNLTGLGTAGAIASLNTATAPFIIPAGNFGYATFVHNGPPGALATNAIIANFSIGLVQPIGMIAPRQ